MTDLSPLHGISTATITMVLLKHGIRNVWLRGTKPLQRGQPRIAGPAFTLRHLPMREDLATPASLASGQSTRVAIEAMPAGCVVVVESQGSQDAGVVGDILCARMKALGVAALVSDGMVRDVAGVDAAGLPVWCHGVAAPASISALTFAGWQVPVACGGVAVFPGDIIVADDDGAVLIPPALLDTVIAAGREQERLEAWILAQVQAGAPLPGLYPANEETLARYRRETAAGS